VSDLRRRRFEEPKIPSGFKLWFALCAVISIGTLGVAVWAVVKLVNHFTGG